MPVQCGVVLNAPDDEESDAPYGSEFEHPLKTNAHFLFRPVCADMPGTHLLPPNLLKLFAPRPPLPYKRPVGKDIDHVRCKDVFGVAAILERIKEQSTVTLLSGEGDTMEEGEEPTFTLAEETKRQIRREERKKKKTEEFKIAKETCK